MRLDADNDSDDPPWLVRELQALEADFKQSALRLRMHGEPEHPLIVVESLRVGRDARHQACASDAVEELKAIADRARAAILVRPLDARTSVYEAQIDFYDRHGFALEADGSLSRGCADRIERTHAREAATVPDTIPEAWSRPEIVNPVPPWEQDESDNPFGARDMPTWSVDGDADDSGAVRASHTLRPPNSLARLSEPVRGRVALAAASMVAIAMTDSWRTMVLGAAVCGVVAATRLRFATYLAVAVLLGLTLLSVGQEGPVRSRSFNACHTLKDVVAREEDRCR